MPRRRQISAGSTEGGPVCLDISEKIPAAVIGEALAKFWAVDGSRLVRTRQLSDTSLTSELIRDPVLLSDGRVYGREVAASKHGFLDQLRLVPLHDVVGQFLMSARFVGTVGHHKLLDSTTCAEQKMLHGCGSLSKAQEVLLCLHRRLAHGLIELRELQSLLDRACEAASELEGRTLTIAASRIQVALRAFRRRRRLNTIRLELRTATDCIATAARTFSARRRLALLWHRMMRRRKAAKRIQKFWRCRQKNLAMLAQLGFAARNGNLEVVNLFINRGAPLDGFVQVSGMAGTPLLYAASNGHVQVAHALLLARADCDKSMREGATPLFMAAQNEHSDVARLLCEFGADANKASLAKATPLFMAAQEGHLEVVRVLCEASVSCDQVLPGGVTPLFIAAQSGHADVVQSLCQSRADQDASAPSGITALFMACQNGHHDVVRVLCTANATKDREIAGNVTPLFMAAQSGHESVVRCLCDTGKELGLLDMQKSVLIANQAGHTGVIAILGSFLSARMDFTEVNV